ncbi:MAG: allantoinase AllB [Terriglobia bacterium]
MNPDLVVRSRRVVTPAGVIAASMHIRDGVITAVGSFEEVPPECAVFEAGDSVVMPGLVDTHVHINEPGRTEWEGFRAATQAAAAGGITTLVEMPLNSIPATTNREAYQAKRQAAQGQCWVDVGFWGGVVPGNRAELRGLYEAGVFGFKCFLVPSGVPEFTHVTEADLRAALPELASLGAVLLVHAELPGPLERTLVQYGNPDPSRYSTWLASRPREAENQAIALLVRMSRGFGARVHVVHLSSSDVLALLRRAKEEAVPITAETCPHYLCFAAEEIPKGATAFKCAPPIREQDNRERLWSALGEGVIDLVASDHSPCPPAMKCRETGDFTRAWGGISSLQLSLPALWTQAKRRGSTLPQLAEWVCRAPARLAGLENRKGAIAAKYDADLVVWNPDASFRVEPEKLRHRHKLTPYAGQTLNGVVEATFLRGVKVYHEGSFPAGPLGAILRRGES